MKKHIPSLLSSMLFAVAFVSVLLGQNSEPTASDVPKETENERNIGDLICGPKCVREILRLYGKEHEDVIRLVREIQWPEVRQGSTLADLAAALKKRGIQTYAMQIKPTARLVWPHPVIVHLKPKQNDDIGHFVVWKPESKGNTVQIWDSDRGTQKHDERQWSKECTGAVLLTSPEPITDPGAAVQWAGLPFFYDEEIMLAWLVFLAGLGLMIKAFRLFQLFNKGEVT